MASKSLCWSYGTHHQLSKPAATHLSVFSCCCCCHADQAASEAAAASSSKAAAASSTTPSSRLLLGMCLFSLQAMAAGGMYDQLGGGFHRYRCEHRQKQVVLLWHVCAGQVAANTCCSPPGSSNAARSVHSNPWKHAELLLTAADADAVLLSLLPRLLCLFSASAVLMSSGTCPILKRCYMTTPSWH